MKVPVVANLEWIFIFMAYLSAFNQLGSHSNEMCQWRAGDMNIFILWLLIKLFILMIALSSLIPNMVLTPRKQHQQMPFSTEVHTVFLFPSFTPFMNSLLVNCFFFSQLLSPQTRHQISPMNVVWKSFYFVHKKSYSIYIFKHRKMIWEITRKWGNWQIAIVQYEEEIFLKCGCVEKYRVQCLTSFEQMIVKWIFIFFVSIMFLALFFV